MVIYGYANVGRYGLAHSLLAWARCEVWCKRHDVPIIAPSWRYLRIGPYRRGERDKRQYHRCFYFPDYICGLKRLYLMRRLPRLASTAVEDETYSEEIHGIVVFENLLSMNEETHFHRIIGHHEHLRQALFSITRPNYRPRRAILPHIALHVRMGDFLNATEQDVRRGVKNARIPISWFRDMLIGIRERLGFDCHAVVYSDGNDEQLRSLLSLKNIRRSPRQPAITDLLSIGDAALLISSGSGFSCWGSFLGQVPRICFPNQRLFRTHTGSTIDFEPECESAMDVSEAVLATISTRLQA